ncbi:hypothetical protein BU14_0082s0045, partial [Porphyra umbilicalis]
TSHSLTAGHRNRHHARSTSAPMRSKSATQKRSVPRPPHHVAFSLPFLPPQPSFPSSPPCCSWVLHVFDGACGLPSVGGRCLVTTAPDPVARTSPAAATRPRANPSHGEA